MGGLKGAGHDVETGKIGSEMRVPKKSHMPEGLSLA
jgi:hypothetical protein